MCVFTAICGMSVLDPDNVGWLRYGDPAQSFLGWSYFRISPWSLPPGANPHYGMEISSSIFFSDSIPLFAFIFKILRPILEVQQYHGWWLLLCFFLQGICGWLLMGLAVRHMITRLLGAVLLCTMPFLLWRLYGHYALMAHWLLLLALWLAIAPPNRRWPFVWASLLCIAALVHSYLLAMTVALWVSDLARRALTFPAGNRRLGLVYLAAEVLVIPGAVALCLWAAGFFIIRSGHAAGGFGVYAMNLLAPIDSDGLWSRLLPDLPNGKNRDAGSNFLGLGLLGLLGAACMAVISRPRLLRVPLHRAPLILVIIGLVAFAISNRIVVAGTDWWVLPLPRRVLDLADILRASERMFWPVAYALTLLGVFLIARSWGGRSAALGLGLAVLVQVADGSAGWPPLRAQFQPPSADRAWQPLHSEFWNLAARNYARVRRLPVADKVAGWDIVGRWTSVSKLPTDMIYLARVDQRALAASRAASEQALLSGQAEPGTLYILGEGTSAVALAALALNPATDLLAHVDGFLVFAPNWKQHHAVPAGVREVTQSEVLPALATGTLLRFHLGAAAAAQEALLLGWSSAEQAGTWNDGTTARLALHLPPAAGPNKPVDIWVKGSAFLTAQQPIQRIAVSLLRDGTDCSGTTEWRFDNGEQTTSWRRIAVPSACVTTTDEGISSGLLQVRLNFSNATSPKELGMSGDHRVLAFSIKELVVLDQGSSLP